MDHRGGARIARSKDLRAAGTLGVLALAAERRLIDVADGFERI
jgi:predicted nucleic acid-binding protein